LLTTAPPGAIVLDATTASVLETVFEVRTEGGRLELGEERSGAQRARRVLGRETPCVGRERELGGVAAIFDECFADGVARAVLVTAPPGTGKSRLVDEALRSIRLRRSDARVVVARGNPVGAGSAYAIAGQLVRSLGLDPEKDGGSSLAAIVGTAMPGEAGARTLAFLRELAGLGGDVADDAVRAARSDPHLLAEAIRTAWVDALRSQTESCPLLLVLEDLHWGDLPSVVLVDAILSRLVDRPLAVLATARPEVDTVFPGLWSKHPLQTFRLGAISRRSGERLVRRMMPDVSPATLAAIVDRAEGHPFFLEEIVRAIASGATADVMPDTVLGTLQMRLDALSPDERTVLRGAAVYGDTFWSEGVHALVPADVDVKAALRGLAGNDLVERSTRGILAAQDEFVLRHALVRDAAYALLPENERASSHELAGRWLESVGFDDASALAEHFDKAGSHARAHFYFCRASQSALDGQDLARASRLVDSARGHATTDEEHGMLDAIEADIAYVRGHVDATTAGGERALGRLRRGSRTWFRAASLVVSSAGNQGDNDRVFRWASEAASCDADDDALGDRIVTLARAVGQLAPAHLAAESDRIYERFAALASDVSTFSAYVAGATHRSRGFYQLWRRGDFFDLLDQTRLAAEAFDRAGMRNDHLNCLVLLGVAKGFTGDRVGGMADVRRALTGAQEAGLRYMENIARMEAGLLLILYGHAQEGMAEASASLEGLRGSERFTFHARHAMAMGALSMGDARRAVDEAILAGGAKVHPRLASRAIAVEAEALVALGDAARAVERARQAVEWGAADAGWEICEGHCELALAEALEAAGDRDAARTAVVAALECLRRVVAPSPSPQHTAAILSVPTPNARVLAAAERLGVALPPWAAQARSS
jgi:hypothetical protein